MSDPPEQAGAAAGFVAKGDVIPDVVLTDPALDLFDHEALARPVAGVVIESETPVTVALFGAWGSGKSTLLRLLGAKLTAAGFRAVTYDAWRFGGTALRRNFIASAARDLGIRSPRYTSGLFESRSVLRIDGRDIVRRFAALVGTLALALGVAALLSLLAWAAIAIAGHFFRGVPTAAEVTRHAQRYGPRVAAVIASAVGLLNLPNLLGARIDRSSLSEDDEFANRFGQLIREARLPRALRWTAVVGLEPLVPALLKKRIVFLIDELDRVGDAEVVSTLVSLRTMLDHAECSFVLAADHAVVEKAVRAGVPQPGPAREGEPYYSTVGAFLDKIFQFQFRVPPLRPTRVLSYARSLVEERGGIWADIRAAEPRALEDLVYVAIPAHVSSPRRVKILLNAVASGMRTAQARQIDAIDRRLEVAKWSVLQVEFPDLAADMLLEPKLPELLLDPQAELSDEQARLVQKYQPRADDAATDTSGFDLVEAGDDRAHQASLLAHQLHTYLEQVSHVENPQRDLLHLEAAGRAAGLVTPELARVLDAAGETDPVAVAAAFDEAPEGEVQAAVRFLAEHSRNLFSVARDRVLTAVCLLAERHPKAIAPLAAAVDSAAPDVLGEGRVLPDGRVGAVVLALTARPDSVGPATERALEGANEELLERVLRIAGAFDPVPQAFAQVIVTAAVTLAVEEPDVLRQVARDAPSSLLTALAESARGTTLSTLLDDEDASAALADVITTIASRGPDVAVVVLPSLLTSSLDLTNGYAFVLQFVEQLGSWLPEPAPCEIALSAIFAAPATDLPRWAPQITSAASDEDLHRVGDRMKEQLRTGAPVASVEQALSLLPKPVAASQEGAGEEPELAEIPWSSADADGRLHVADVYTRILAWQLVPSVSGVLEADLERGLAYLLDEIELVDAAAELAKRLAPRDLRKLDDALAAIEPATPGVAVNRLLLRLQLRSGLASDLEPISAAAVASVVVQAKETKALSAGNARVFRQWVLSDTTDDKALGQYLRRKGVVVWRDVLAEWAKGTTQTRAANLWLHLAKGRWEASVLTAVAGARQLEPARIEAYIGELAASDDGEKKKRALELSRTVPLNRADGRRIALHVAEILLKDGDATERAAALRLLTDAQPRRIEEDVLSMLRGLPASMLKRVPKQGRGFLKKLGVID